MITDASATIHLLKPCSRSLVSEISKSDGDVAPHMGVPGVKRAPQRKHGPGVPDCGQRLCSVTSDGPLRVAEASNDIRHCPSISQLRQGHQHISTIAAMSITKQLDNRRNIPTSKR